MKCLFKIFISGLVIFGLLGDVSAQTRLYFGGSGNAGPDSLSIPVFLENIDAVAGIQFDMTDDSNTVKIDSLVLAEDLSGFTAMTRNNRVLIFHEQGKSIQSGDQKIADMLLRLKSRPKGPDTLRFASDIVLADTLAQQIENVKAGTGVLVFSPETGIYDPEIAVPTEFVLYQNYPNPFNNETVIRFDLPQAGQVRLDLFDIQGKKVLSIVNRYYNSGSFNINLDMQGFASGVYIYRLQTNSIIFTRKFLLLK